MLGTYGFREEKVVVFGFDSEVFENGIRPKALHVILRGSAKNVCDSQI